MKKTIIVAIVLCFAFNLGAKVRLPSLLGDNMVLQRNDRACLWGWAEPGSTVKVSTSWDNANYKTEADKDGRWSVRVNTGEAGGPYSITVSDGETLTLSNVLLGEVWICSGQSNMEMPVQGYFGQPAYGAVEALSETSSYSGIRMFTVQRDSSRIVRDDCTGEWLCSNPKNVGAFSAVGYHFGKTLSKYIGVPIGLISTVWGGSNIEAWMSSESLASIQYDREFEDEYYFPDSILYNGMVAPLTNFTARGFIWYQGEANHLNYYDYKTMFVEMVRQWRDAWGNNQMPFYYVEIAPYRYDGAELRAIPLLWEQQEAALKEIPHSGMAGTLDLGLFSIIHEPDKPRVGQRLAYLALNRDYGIEGVPADAPTYKSMRIEGTKAVLSFNNLAKPDDQSDPRSFSWLDADGKVISVKGFEIAGEDRVFYPATARLRWNDNEIEVYAEQVQTPAAVRYGFRNFVEANVKTTLDQPLLPFRTDDWEIPANEIFNDNE